MTFFEESKVSVWKSVEKVCKLIYVGTETHPYTHVSEVHNNAEILERKGECVSS